MPQPMGMSAERRQMQRHQGQCDQAPGHDPESGERHGEQIGGDPIGLHLLELIGGKGHGGAAREQAGIGQRQNMPGHACPGAMRRGGRCGAAVFCTAA